MIFAILTHCPNTKDINNYFARTPGRWFCLGAMLKGRPLAPIDYFSENPQGSNPRLVSEAPPSSFHQSLMALVLTTLRFAKMSRGAAAGRQKLSDLYNLSSHIRKQGFQTVDLLSAFVNPGGYQIDLDARSSTDFDLKADLLNGRVKSSYGN